MTEILVSAVVGGIVSLVVAYFTSGIRARNDLAKLREELKLEYAIETAIIHLLEHPEFKKRSLKKIQRHLRGFSDADELRMALLRAGAVAFNGEGEEEMWGLLSRNARDIK